RENKRLSTSLALQQGLMFSEQGDPGRAAHWLARGLQIAGNENPDLERVLRLNLSSCQSQLPTLKAMLPHNGEVLATAFSPDGKVFATGCSDGAIQLWNALSNDPIGSAMKAGGPVYALAFSPDGQKLLTGTGVVLSDQEKGSAQVWSVVSRTPLGSALPHP